MGGRGDRPGGRTFGRDVGTGKLCRRGRFGSLSGTGTGARTHSRGAAARGQSPGRNQAATAPATARPPASRASPAACAGKSERRRGRVNQFVPTPSLSRKRVCGGGLGVRNSQESEKIPVQSV